MITCPNKKDPEVAREFEELVQATSEQAAYHIWSLNNGNAIDRAPNGAPSKLFQTLLEYYNGDRTKAIQAKAKTYGTSFLLWFGEWTGNFDFDKYTENLRELDKKHDVLFNKFLLDDGKSPISIDNGFGRRFNVDIQINGNVVNSQLLFPTDWFFSNLHNIESENVQNKALDDATLSALKDNLSRINSEIRQYETELQRGTYYLEEIDEYFPLKEDSKSFMRDRIKDLQQRKKDIERRLEDDKEASRASKKNIDQYRQTLYNLLFYLYSKGIEKAESDFLEHEHDDDNSMFRDGWITSKQILSNISKLLGNDAKKFFKTSNGKDVLGYDSDTEEGYNTAKIYVDVEGLLDYLKQNYKVSVKNDIINNITSIVSGKYRRSEEDVELANTEIDKILKEKDKLNEIITHLKSTPVSKVVDENGEPLVVYHGSPNDHIQKFDKNKIGSTTDKGVMGRGFYFTPLKSYAKTYGKNIYPVYLNIKNPVTNLIDSDVIGRSYDELKKDPQKLYDSAYKRAIRIGRTEDQAIQSAEYHKNRAIELNKKAEYLLQKGYDGGIYLQRTTNQINPSEEQIVVPNPNQIKSIDNEGSTPYEGTFSRENDDIYYQRSSNVNLLQIQEELDTKINLAIQDQLKKDSNTSNDQILNIKEDITRSWVERRQQEILGQTQLRLAEAFGLKRNEDGSWYTDGKDEISNLRLEFVQSLGDHAGHISINEHATYASYVIQIGLLEGDASTFNHELAHYYLHVFKNSKLVQKVADLVYDKKRHGDLNTKEGRRALEEDIVEMMTERSVDNMFDVKLAQKGGFQRFWEAFNKLLYKVFKIKTKTARNAILDQITQSFLVNETLDEVKSEARFKFLNNASLNQSKKGVTYKTRKERRNQQYVYQRTNTQDASEKTVQDIVSGVQRKARLYSQRSVGDFGTIYGDAERIAANQEAVRQVKIKAQEISDAALAKDAQAVLHGKAQLFRQFLDGALEEITHLSRLLDNAAANDYRKFAFTVDDAGNKQYSTDDGQIVESTPGAKTQDFTYDELEYLRDNVVGFIEPIVSGISSILVDAQQLGYSDEDIAMLQEFMTTTGISSQVQHVITKYQNATKRKINQWIDETVDARTELDDDFKNRLKINMYNWVSDQMIFGDLSVAEVWVGVGQHSESPVVSAMQDMINDMTDERDEAVYQKGVKLMNLLQKARKSVGLKYKLFGMNLQTLLMQHDRRGLPTGGFIREYNDGQYRIDLDNARTKFAFGKNGLESKLQALLGKDFQLKFDQYGMPIVPENKDAEKLAKEYLRKEEEWKCDHADRQFTKKYYMTRLDMLSYTTLKVQNELNHKIQDITDSITVNGKLRLDLLQPSQEEELLTLQQEREFLGSIYTPDGVLKEEGSVEAQIAEEISAFRFATKGAITYTTDMDAYNESLTNAKDKSAFEARYVHWQINPEVYNQLEKVTYTNPEFTELYRKLAKLQSTKATLLGQYRGVHIGEIKWNKIVGVGGVLKQKNFWQALQYLDEQISEVLNEIDYVRNQLETLGTLKKQERPGFKFKDVLRKRDIPYELFGKDSWNKGVTILQRLKNTIRQRIESDPNLSDEEKRIRVFQELSSLEYYSAVQQTTVPLSIFSTSIPEVDQIETRSGENIPTFVQIPSGLFRKIDIQNSSDEYVNKSFDNSYGFEKPNEQYKDKRFEVLKNEDLNKLYKELVSTMQDAWSMIPFLQKYDNRLPQINARVGQMLGRKWYTRLPKNIYQFIKYEFEIVDDEQYLSEIEAGRRGVTGQISQSIPLRFINRLEKPEYISSDIVGSVIAFYSMAKNWQIKSKNLSFFTQLAQRSGQMNFQPTGNLTEYKQSHHSKVIEGILERQMYESRTILGEKKGIEDTKKTMNRMKKLSKIRAISQLSLLANNFTSALISFLDPLLSMIVDSITGKYINVVDDIYALSMLFGNIGHVRSIGRIRANNKVQAAMQKFHLTDSTVSMFKDTDQSQFMRFITDGLTMKSFSWGDYTMNALSTIATMHNYKAYEFKDEHIEFLPEHLFIKTAMEDRKCSAREAKRIYNSIHTKNMWGCTEEKGGLFVAKDNKYGNAITDATWKAVRKQIQSRSSLYTGVVGSTERTMMQSDVILSFITMMRNFLITGIWDRFKNLRHFQVTTFDEDGNPTFDNIAQTISTKEAKKTQRYYKGGFNWSTRQIEDGIYQSAAQYFKQLWPNLKYAILSTKFAINNIFTGDENIVEKHEKDKQQYKKEHDLNDQAFYGAHRVLLELALIASLLALVPISQRVADDDKDNYWKQVMFLLNIRVAIERVTYYSPSTIAEIISSPTSAKSAFSRMFKGIDLILEGTNYDDKQWNDVVKAGNFKGAQRWQYNLFNVLSPFGVYNWYVNMPEIEIGGTNIGGGGGYPIREKAKFYKSWIRFVDTILPYGKSSESSETNTPKTFDEKLQDRLNKIENFDKVLEEKQKRLDRKIQQLENFE